MNAKIVLQTSGANRKLLLNTRMHVPLQPITCYSKNIYHREGINNMKKIIVLLTLSFAFILSGCGLLEETQNTINYATEATEYIDELNNFAEEAQNIISEGNVNMDQLGIILNDIEESISQFNGVNVPSIAVGIHESIISKNEQLLSAIHKVEENGEIAIEEIQNSEIFQTIESITNLMDKIEQLGF